ncbi:putative bacteriophage protein [Pseudomonas aeruginosa]|nr:putative bacteriophage protein [Pseudomonas aeruginosa]
MIGMDRRSGQPLSGLAHLKQSIEDILTTPWAAGACGPSTAASCGGCRPAAERGLEKRGAGRGGPRTGALGAAHRLSSVRVVAVVEGRVGLLLSGVFEGEDINMEISA